jgi:hypothetical protein
LLVGLINFYPLIGVLGPAQLQSLYGLEFAGADLQVLMRHRAVLLGIVGGLLIIAAFRPTLRVVAAIVGLVSMVTFLMLALPVIGDSAALARVFWADVVASGLLAAGLAIGQKVR